MSTKDQKDNTKLFYAELNNEQDLQDYRAQKTLLIFTFMEVYRELQNILCETHSHSTQTFRLLASCRIQATFIIIDNEENTWHFSIISKCWTRLGVDRVKPCTYVENGWLNYPIHVLYLTRCVIHNTHTYINEIYSYSL